MNDPLNIQMKRRISNKSDKKEQQDEGNFEKGVISTGSTLLDLAISAGRTHGGGLPGGIIIEIFGKESSGKTVICCETGGNIQRQDGDLIFHDAEGRLDEQFSRMLGMKITDRNYYQPKLVREIYSPIYEWKPEGKGIHGIITDSLAALSTDTEMEKIEGDKMGGRRAKEFSEGFRKTRLIIRQNNYLMLCTNQIRDTFNTFGRKTDSSGGWAIRFYSSLRLETEISNHLLSKVTVAGKEISREVGIRVNVKVAKNSIWKPYRSAPLTILFDYGIDDVRENLQFLKDYSKENVYHLDGHHLHISLKESIAIIEKEQLEDKLREAVILRWNEIESQFNSNRKPKMR